MKLSIFILSLFCWVLVPSTSFAGDGHDHSKKESKKDKGKHAHSEEDGDHDKKGEDKHNHSEEAGDHEEDHDDKGEDKHAHPKGAGNHEEDHDEEGEDEHAHSEEAGEDDHGGGSGIGPGKAILEVANEGNKFKLSKESEAFLKIGISKIESIGDNYYRIPKTSIVTYQNSKGVYIKSNGWFEIKKITVFKTENGFLVISGMGINTNTLIASKGLGFLRAAHLQASGQGGKGHAH